MDAPLNFSRQAGTRLEPERADDELFTISEVVERLRGLVRRQFPVFVLTIACCLALGLVYLATTPPSYTSHAMLLIDSSKLSILHQQQQTPVGDLPIDTEHVETQVEILKSENIGLSVVRELKLTQAPEFVQSGTGLLGWMIAQVVTSEEQSHTNLERIALARFLAKRSITRVAKTYVLDVGFISLNAARSAAIANAIADAYIVDQLEAKYQATKRASGWLQDRIKELRQQTSDADRAVLDYKEKNKIIAVGANSAGGARLLGEQQVEDLNTQLGTARAAAEEAKARLERINDVMQRDVPDASVADSLHSEVIIRLRNNYLDIAAKESIWSARYGSGHLAAVNLRTQMTELRRAIHDELGHIAESYKSDYEISKTRVVGVERELQKLVVNSQVTNRDKLGLTDLESTAKVYHSIYDNFLQKYMEAIQQQSFPLTEARVISAAAAPEHKSSPKAWFVLGLAVVIGLAASAGVAVLREAVDRVFRTVRQVEADLHAHCLAVLPKLTDSDASKKTDFRKQRPIEHAGVPADTQPASPSVSAASPAGAKLDTRLGSQLQSLGLAKIPQITQSELRRNLSKKDYIRLSEGTISKRLIIPRQPFMRHVIDQPLSPFAETFRSIKVAADISGSRTNNKIIGLTSTVAGEGKSTVSSNLALLMAQVGKRVILLDGDLRNPSLTRVLARGAGVGLLEVLLGQVALDDAIYVDEETGLAVLPSVVDSGLANSNEVLASDAFRNFADDLRKAYDYIVIDLSPIAPVVDVRATTQIIDSFIYIVEWGKTQRSLVQHQLAGIPELHERLLGIVLNKVDVRLLQRYGEHYGKHYYARYGSQNPDEA
jgi:succinoglycan biosynthesis transport protein ExoP